MERYKTTNVPSIVIGKPKENKFSCGADRVIIPIATTISSWFNSFLLFVYLKNNDLFEFNKIFFKKFVKIVLASIMMGIFFKYLIFFFENELSYAHFFKSIYLVLCVLLTIIFYFALSYFIKAFNYQDIKLKY